MHYCPCCKLAFHASCLFDDGFVDLLITEERAHERLLKMEVACSRPFLDDCVKGAVDSACVPQWDGDRHELLPLELLRLARSPMVRGDGADIPKKWSITGNLAIVSAARQLVAAVLRTSFRVQPSWASQLGIPLNEEGPVDVLAWAVDDTGLRCPKCTGPI